MDTEAGVISFSPVKKAVKNKSMKNLKHQA